MEPEAITDDSLLRLFAGRGALLEGHFLLTSGLHAPRYLQCARVLMDPALATRLGAELASRLRPLLGSRSAGCRPAARTWVACSCPERRPSAPIWSSWAPPDTRGPANGCSAASRGPPWRRRPCRC